MEVSNVMIKNLKQNVTREKNNILKHFPKEFKILGSSSPGDSLLLGKDRGGRQPFWKEPLGGTNILFCWRG